MADKLPVETASQQPAARHYALLSGLMLFVMTILLSQRVAGSWAAMVLLFGVAFLMMQWRDGPVLILAFVAWLLASEGVYGEPAEMVQTVLIYGLRYYAMQYARPFPVLEDFLLAGAFLVFVASYYRSISLTRHLFPLDPRRRPYAGLPAAERRQLLEETQRRSPETVALGEFGMLALAVPFAIAGAAVFWYWTMHDPPSRYDFDSVLSSALKLLYFFAVPLLLFRAGIIYSNRCRASRAESEIYLQEQLWRETRREQSRINRWLTWARLRAQERKENA